MLIDSLSAGVATLNTADPLAGLDGVLAGGTLIGLALTVVFFVWLVVLGVLLPWFVWRTKVYTKRQYLLSRKMFELMRQAHLRGAP